MTVESCHQLGGSGVAQSAQNGLACVHLKGRMGHSILEYPIMLALLSMSMQCLMLPIAALADAIRHVALQALADPVEAPKEVSVDKLKPVPRPDENELKDKVDEVNAKISSLQARLAAIKENLDSRESGRGDSPEVQLSKVRVAI